MTARRTGARIRQVAELKLRRLEAWRCAAGHEFALDPDRAGPGPYRCPVVLELVPQGAGFKWLGCEADTHRTRAAGPLTERDFDRLEREAAK